MFRRILLENLPLSLHYNLFFQDLKINLYYPKITDRFIYIIGYNTRKGTVLMAKIFFILMGVNIAPGVRGLGVEEAIFFAFARHHRD